MSSRKPVPPPPEGPDVQLESTAVQKVLAERLHTPAASKIQAVARGFLQRKRNATVRTEKTKFHVFHSNSDSNSAVKDYGHMVVEPLYEGPRTLNDKQMRPFDYRGGKDLKEEPIKYNDVTKEGQPEASAKPKSLMRGQYDTESDLTDHFANRPRGQDYWHHDKTTLTVPMTVNERLSMAKRDGELQERGAYVLVKEAEKTDPYATRCLSHMEALSKNRGMEMEPGFGQGMVNTFAAHHRDATAATSTLVRPSADLQAARVKFKTDDQSTQNIVGRGKNE